LAKKKSSKKKSQKKDDDKPDLSFLPIWAKKLKKDVEELETQLEVLANGLRDKHKNWSVEKIYATARRRLYSSIKSEFRSSAAPWLVCPLYGSEPFDWANYKFQQVMAIYNNNPKEAIAKKMVQVKKNSRGIATEVIPIDSNQFTKSGKQNRNFGKPMKEHSWIQTIGGIAMPMKAAENEEWDKIRPCEIILSNQTADPTSQVYKGIGFNFGNWYKIKLNNRTKKENEESWELNVSTASKWEDYEELDFDKSQLKEYFVDYYAPLSDIEEYHDTYAENNATGTKQFNKRIIVTEGEVVDIIISEDPNNSNRILIDDESLGLADEEGNIIDSVNCWANSNVKLNFGKFSRIMVIGNTSRGLKKDLATGETLNEWGNVSISVLGITVIDLVEPDPEDENGGDGEYEEVEVDDEEYEEPNIENEESTEEKPSNDDGDRW